MFHNNLCLIHNCLCLLSLHNICVCEFSTFLKFSIMKWRVISLMTALATLPPKMRYVEVWCESVQVSILISLFVSLKFCLIKFSFPLFLMNILLNFLSRLCKANIPHGLINFSHLFEGFS